MRTSHFLTGILVSAVSITATGAFAFGKHHRGPGADISFEQLDTNGDGQITKDEMQTHKADRFDDADTNGDGVLSAAELQAKAQEHAAQRVKQMLAHFDENNDGALSPDEMPKPRHQGRMFDRFDQDGSGGISAQEFDEARADIRSHRKSRWGLKRHKD